MSPLSEYYSLIGEGVIVGALFMSLSWLIGYIISYVIGLFHKA